MRHIAAIGGLAIFTIATVHCSGLSTAGDCTDYDTCQGLNGEGGTGDSGDGGIEGAVIPPNCDVTKPVKDSPDCVDNGVGIFVAPSGDDTAPGTKEKPVRSITKAAELASLSTKPRVYICTGTYTDSVDVKSPISFFGGFTCSGGQWTQSGAGVQWNAVKAEFALRIVGVGQRVAIEDVEITAKDATAPGESSIGIFVAETTELALSRTNVIAGKGSNGETKLKKAARAAAGKGGPAVNPNGGPGTKNTCSDGDSLGGKGGTAGLADATAGQPALGGGAPGPDSTACGSGGSGGTGADGSEGDAAPGVTSLGALTREGWKASGGVVGKPGTRAQGGGGGGARTGAGGGGGAGGCGGDGGEPGGGGGASVAILSFSTKLSINGGKVRAGAAGNGGGGAGGQPGQPPGAGGDPGIASPASGCPGGDGGSGGKGGAGGGGAGGVSAAILFKGTQPTIAGAELAKGTPGQKGLGGDLVGAADGPEGQAAETLAAP